jgi:hypothetical protein
MLINDASITGSLIVNASASFQNISVGGNIIPDETNIRNLGSTDKYFKEIYVSTGSINFVDGGNIVAILNSDTLEALQNNTASANTRLTVIERVSASLQSFTASISETNTFTSSATARLNALESTSASIDTLNTNQNNRLGSLETISASNISRISALETTSASVNTLNTTQNSRLTSLETTSASVDTLNTTQNTRLTNLEIKTGSLATTGSNTFIGTQTITGSLFISANLVVQGTSSLENITASAVSIGTNIVNLNTANPAIRYAGLSIGDSGSVGGSGSFLYDSVQDEMIFVHRGANTTITSSVVLMGPQTFDSIGSETYPTANRIQKGTGNEHLVDSCIFDNGTTICVNGNLIGSGNACITSICSPAFVGGTISGTNATFSSNITACGGVINCSDFRYAPSGTATNNPNLVFKDSGNSALDIASETIGDANVNSRPIAFRVSNPTSGRFEAMRISCNGNIGIGITNPSEILHLKDNTNGYVGLRFQGDSSYAGSDWTIYASSVNAPSVNDFLGFYNNSTTDSASASYKMRIFKNGNVSIGTDSPSGLFHVSQEQNASSAYYFSNPASGTSSRVRVILDSDTSAGNLSLGMHSSTHASTPNEAWVWTSGTSTPLIFGTLGTERMRILPNGSTVLRSSLGICNGGAINMTIPNGSNGGSIRMACCTGANEGDMYFTGGGGVGILLAGSGRVGIGTTIPSAPLSIRCDSSSGAAFMEIATCFQNAYRYVSINGGTGIAFCIPGGTSQSPFIEVQGGDPSATGGSFRIRTGAMGSVSDKLIVTQNGPILACGRMSSIMASNGNIQEWVGTIGSVANNTGYSLFSIVHQYDNLAMDIYVFTDVGSFQASKHEAIFGYTSGTYIGIGFSSAFCIFKTGTLYNETMTICNLSGAQVNNQRIAIRVWGYGVGQNGTGGGNLLNTSCLTRIK